MLSLSGCGGGSSSSAPTPQPPAGPGANTDYLYVADLNQITKFAIDGSTGALSAPSGVPGPNNAFSMTTDPNRKSLYVSDFTGHAIDAFSISTTDGSLATINGSPFPVGDSNGPGGIVTDPAGNFLFVAFPGVTPYIYEFRRDANSGALSLVGPPYPFPAGMDPWDLVVHPTKNFLYADHFDENGDISAFTFDPVSGLLTEVAGSPFPTQSNWPGPGRLAIDPTGKFLYVGLGGEVNANHYVAGFSIDQTSGILTPLAGSPFATGSGPFHIAVDLSGKYLYTANSQDSTISAFIIDATTGVLNPVSGSPFATGGYPFAIAIDSSGQFLYTGNQSTRNISAFRINTNSGVLTPISGSPFGNLGDPMDLIAVKVRRSACGKVTVAHYIVKFGSCSLPAADNGPSPWAKRHASEIQSC